MSRFAPTLCAWLLPLLLLAGCSSIPVPKIEIEHHTVTLTPESSGTPVTIGMDQELLLRLDDDPIRGLRWFRDTTTAYADRGVLIGRLGDPTFERAKADTNTFGAAGFNLWHFAPKSAGQQVLRFELRRIGEAQAPLQVATYTITVR